MSTPFDRVRRLFEGLESARQSHKVTNGETVVALAFMLAAVVRSAPTKEKREEVSNLIAAVVRDPYGVASATLTGYCGVDLGDNILESWTDEGTGRTH